MIKMKFELKGFDKPILPTGMKGKRMMKLWGLAAVRTIRERVQAAVALPTAARHITTNDRPPFLGYSRKYREYKQGIGRRPETKGDWLILTGQMLKALDIVFVSPNKVVVGFWGSHSGARPKSKLTKEGRRRRRARTKRESIKDPSKAYYKTHMSTPKAPKPIVHAHLAAINDEIRPFVGLTPKEVDRITTQAWVRLQFGGK